MTDLRELNSAVQDSAFPSVQFAQAVREWIVAATERMEPASEGAKVECPNCGQPGEHYHSGDMPHVPAFYTCQPAQREYDAKPQDFGSLLDAQHRHIQEIRASREPAAPVGEMPEAVHHAWLFLDVIGQRDRFAREAAVKLRDWWRTHAAQPKVAMTEELERVLEFAYETTEMRDPGEGWMEEHLDKMQGIIAAVREQAAGVKLSKVRAYFDSLCKLPQYHNEQGRDFLEGIYAELDAAEGKAETKEGK